MISVGNKQIDLLTNTGDSDFYEGPYHAIYVAGQKVWEGYAHEIAGILTGLFGATQFVHTEINEPDHHFKFKDRLEGSYS